jgi:hypothetical protein
VSYCSHLFLLRQKTIDERSAYGDRFGTHSFICLKKRFLGRDIAGELAEVEMPDGTKRKNFINFEINNFSVEEKGDLRDIARW